MISVIRRIITLSSDGQIMRSDLSGGDYLINYLTTVSSSAGSMVPQFVVINAILGIIGHQYVLGQWMPKVREASEARSAYIYSAKEGSAELDLVTMDQTGRWLIETTSDLFRRKLAEGGLSQAIRKTVRLL